MTAKTKSTPVVLVADDDIATRYVVSRSLTNEGFSVVEAGNGREAVAHFNQQRPNIILMDVEMPELDGYQACSVIRQSEGGADLPIVMVTGLDDPGSIDRAYEVGATDFISKPINWSLLGHRLRYILRGARNYQALEVSEAENCALIAAIPDSIFTVNDNGLILTCINGEGMFGDSQTGRICGQSIQNILPGKLRNDVLRSIGAVSATGEIAVLEYHVDRPDEKTRWYESRFVRHSDSKVLIIIRDISIRKRAEKRVHSLAYYDSLTGLPNRILYKERFEEMLGHAKSTESSVAVFDIDLNRFKRINDTLGSPTGDAVLIEAATRLSKFVDDLFGKHEDGGKTLDCCLARVGGNEFALSLADPENEFDCSWVSQQIRKVLAKPIVLKGHEFVVTASTGVAKYPEHGDSVETLLKNAESATGEAKRLGGNTSKLYRSSMNSRTSERLEIENELRRALENDELSVYYQPKYCTRTLENRGAEALLRWFHPVRGEIRPAAFIPVAEESGLIADLGQWVATTVCEQISCWQYFGVPCGPIAINMSGQEFGLGDPVSVLTEAVRKADIHASALELEITETVLLSDLRSVMSALHVLREQGFSIAVDDFGTGYSSLRYLQKLPVDVLKIDSSFVHDVEKNAGSRAICTAIIALARSLGLKVVGEGVETSWQFEFLKRQACDTVQGFLLSKPLSTNDFTAQLKHSLGRVADTQQVIQISSRIG